MYANVERKYKTLYWTAHAIVGFLAKALFAMKTEGLENLPASGPAVVACNHVSILDPILVGAAMPRLVHFMAKEELFHIPVLGFLIRKIGSFPVRRGNADRQAIRAGLEVLEAGEVLGIFPEGTRSLDGHLQRAQSGVALLAMKTGTPVIPAAIVGTEKALRKGRAFLRPARVRLLLGPPIHPPAGEITKESLAQFSARIMLAIAGLRDQLLAEGSVDAPPSLRKAQ